MDDQRAGAAIRAVRVHRGWRQQDVGRASGVSATTVSRIERGHLQSFSLGTLRSVSRSLDIRLDVVPRWRGADLDRLLARGHSAMHESLARYLNEQGWVFAPEVSFSVYGERGIIDILAWHEKARTVLVIELKTQIVDVQSLVASMDIRRRLSREIARDRGWLPLVTGAWVVVADSSTNGRRLAAHSSMLRAAFPDDGRRVRAWMRAPSGGLSALSFWPISRRECQVDSRGRPSPWTPQAPRTPSFWSESHPGNAK